MLRRNLRNRPLNLTHCVTRTPTLPMSFFSVTVQVNQLKKFVNNGFFLGGLMLSQFQDF
jgi:hypothetical protein